MSNRQDYTIGQFKNILLLGEATFHQFHGGVVTNVAMSDHLWDEMHEEYKRIRLKGFE